MLITSGLPVLLFVTVNTLCPAGPGVLSIEHSPEELDAVWRHGPQPAAQTLHSGPTAQRVALGNPRSVGMWEDPLAWDVIAIHASLMPTGQVLQYSYPSEGPGSRARLWDPVSGQFTPVNMATDIFCSGLSLLPDGSLYVTGGNDYTCEFQGRTVTHRFDPFTQSWTKLEDMTVGRWYPTNITIGDGSVRILSGLNLFCHVTHVMEAFTPGVGLQVVPEGERYVELYPRLHLLTSGKIAHVGIENETYTFDPGAGQWEYVDSSNFGWRCQGTSVLIPGRTDQILCIGGNCPVTSSCEIIDFAAAKPEWRWTASMDHPRAHANALILPNKTVLVVGGGTDDLYGDPVFIPELFDPQSETWTELPPHQFGRMYHSTMVLLPDARVLIAGQDNGQSMFWGEIYDPAYLFRGVRPEISAVPNRIAYNRPVSLASPQADAIDAVALLALSAVTHSVNINQRYVELSSVLNANGSLNVLGPPDGNHAPPGYYMLFILNGDGVPSEAAFVQLGSWPPADLDSDGEVGPADLALLLGAWGPGAGNVADLDGNGAVDPVDLAFLLGHWG